MLVSEEVGRRIAAGSGTLDHGFTYQAHPPSLAAGIAVQRYIEAHGLVERSRQLGDLLAERLECLRRLPCVGDVRGKGLLQTVEFVADKKTRQPFAADRHFSARVFDELRDCGALVYAMSGTVDGVSGDHILIAPPFVIEEAEIDWFVGALQQSIERVYQVSAA